MVPQEREYAVLASHWGRHWDVFVLDPVEGLLGSTEAVTLAEVEYAARRFLGQRLRRPPRRFRLTVLRS